MMTLEPSYQSKNVEMMAGPIGIECPVWSHKFQDSSSSTFVVLWSDRLAAISGVLLNDFQTWGRCTRPNNHSGLWNVIVRAEEAICWKCARALRQFVQNRRVSFRERKINLLSVMILGNSGYTMNTYNWTLFRDFVDPLSWFSWLWIMNLLVRHANESIHQKRNNQLLLLIEFRDK